MKFVKHLIWLLPVSTAGMTLLNFVPLIYRLQYCTFNSCTIPMGFQTRLFAMGAWATLWGVTTFGMVALAIFVEDGSI